MGNTGGLDYSRAFQFNWRGAQVVEQLSLFKQALQLLQVARDSLRILGKLLVGHVRSPI